jgi:hypothetical protein
LTVWAENPNKADDAAERIQQLVEANDNSGAQNAARQFVRQALQGRVRDYVHISAERDHLFRRIVTGRFGRT